MRLVKMMYDIFNRFPKEERYSLTDQMRRSAISIPSNIAEGQARDSEKDFIRFLKIAKASAAELETQLIISNMIGYIKEDELHSCEEQIHIVQRMIVKLVKSVEARLSQSTNNQ